MPLNREFLVERQGRQFALYQGLLDLAHQEGLRAIAMELMLAPTDANGQTAICRATVVTEKGTFTGLGDANPTNVGRMLLPHLLLQAETRAKARALRDAVNVGVAIVEELGEVGPDGAGAGPQDLAAHPRPSGRPLEPACPTADLSPEAPSWPAPARAAGAATPPDPNGKATEPQVRLLRELSGRLGGREVPAGLTRMRASNLIDQWKVEAPRS